MPNTCSKPFDPACGKVEKIPPPLLSITKILRFSFGVLVRAEISCKNVKSPMMELVVSCSCAIPNTVEIFPSIPAKPRLAKTKIPL